MDQRDKADRSSFYRRLLQERTRDPSVPLERFCRRHSISLWTYYHWKKRLGFEDAAFKKVTAPIQRAFVPVSVSPAHDGMEIRLREGIVIRIPGSFDRDIFKAIIETVSTGTIP
jgi:hypothetical protein